MTKTLADKRSRVVPEENSTPSDTSNPSTVEPVSVDTENAVVNTRPVENSSPALTDIEFTREAVEAQGNHIKQVDRDEDAELDLFCYVKCSPNDNAIIRNCRGVVFHKDQKVLQGFPYTTEYNHTQLTELENVFPSLEGYSVYHSYEGALVRVFYFSGKWYVSTHRKLDAFRSKWASRESFGSIFKRSVLNEVNTSKALGTFVKKGETDEETYNNFFSLLNKNHQYMFLIRNTPENRIVSLAPENPTMFHVGTFVEGKLNMSVDIGVRHPEKHNVLNLDELCNYISKMDPKYLQGVIVFLPDGVTQVKVLNKEYQELFDARGNEPSVKFRYLQVRMNKNQTRMLYYLYPEHRAVFDEYEDTLYDIARTLYRAYVQRFIKRRYITVPNQEFQIIRECHEWHREDPKENRINIQKVIDVLNTQPPTNLNHIIRRYKADQIKKKEQNKAGTPRPSIFSPKNRSTPRRTIGPSPGGTSSRHSSGPVSPMMLPRTDVAV